MMMMMMNTFLTTHSTCNTFLAQSLTCLVRTKTSARLAVSTRAVNTELSEIRSALNQANRSGDQSFGSVSCLNVEQEAFSSDASIETHNIPADASHLFGEFGEVACGEPQAAQHLVIDFTHGEQDTAFEQKKCCAFWEFIESHPEIHHMMVVPDSRMYLSTSSSETSSEAADSPEEESGIKEHTAVSMLDFVSREGLIDKSFEAKIPQTFCPLGSREYLENQTTRKPTKPKRTQPVCRCGGRCNTCSRIQPAEKVPHSTDEVRNLCENMKKWDLNHPKSMEPPGRSVPLIHCALQRKVSCTRTQSPASPLETL